MSTELYNDVVALLGNYMIIPRVEVILGICVFVLAILCIVFSFFYRKGKAGGLRAFNRVLSGVMLGSFVVLVAVAAMVSLIVLAGAYSTYERDFEYYVYSYPQMYDVFLYAAALYGVPYDLLNFVSEQSMDAGVAVILVYHLSFTLIPAIAALIAFFTAHRASLKYKAARIAIGSGEQPVLPNQTAPFAQPFYGETVRLTPASEQPAPQSYAPAQDGYGVCANCGAPLDGGSFCSRCGCKTEVSQRCTNCGAVLNPGSKFCNQCGNRL